jgi:hypothetical protein
MATPPINATLLIHQGTTWRKRWRITDPDTGTPRDLTEWSARAQVRADHSADSVVLAEWLDDTVTCDADGYVTITVSPAVSSAWTWRDGMYDVELVDPAGQVARIAQGAVRVSPEVTR